MDKLNLAKDIITVLISGLGVGTIQEKRIQKLKDEIAQLKSDKIRLEENHKCDIIKIEENLKNKYNSEEYVKQQIIDFLALINDELGLNEIVSKGVLAEELKQNNLDKCNKEFEYSIKAIDGLLYSDINGKKLLKGLVYRVIFQITKDDNNEEFRSKCRELYSYLRGWLICSIRYKNDKLPIEWINNNALSKKEKIEALECTKKIIMNDEKIREKIGNQFSRKLICKYIDILLLKI